VLRDHKKLKKNQRYVELELEGGSENLQAYGHLTYSPRVPLTQGLFERILETG